MRLTKVISKLRFSVLTTFIVINFASTDLMAGGWVWTGAAHGCWVFHTAPHGYINPPRKSTSSGKVWNNVMVDCTVSSKGHQVESITMETQLQRSILPSSGYRNFYWKKSNPVLRSNGQRWQSFATKCRKSPNYYYASTSRISAKLKSGKRLGYSKWFNKKPNARTRNLIACGWILVVDHVR